MIMADVSLMVIPPTMTGTILFAPGKADEVLTEIKEKARAEAALLDISTEEGRAAIASLSYKIARTKTATDKMRLELVADRKKEVKLIDSEGGRIWDELEALQKEVRRPLTEWENVEKDRVAGHEEALQLLTGMAALAPTASKDSTLLQIAEAKTYAGREWEEFTRRGAAAVSGALAALNTRLTVIAKEESDAAELAQLRAESAKREQKEREEAAAARAKAEAEEKARREAQEAERRAKEEQDRIRREAQEQADRAAREAAEREAAIERERKAAQERAEQAERDRIAAEAKAKRDAEAAAQKAEEDKKAAVRAEQDRAERERKAAEDEERKRAANRAHSAKINNEAEACILNHTNLSAEAAEEVIKAIAKGLVSHVSIQY
jgi:hypothetical protein